MEDFHNNVSQDFSHNCNNISSECNHGNEALSVKNVVTCIIICIGLPLTLIAIYAVYSLVQKDHVAPIYVINLLISDLIQFCCLIARVARHEDEIIFDVVFFIYNCGVVASIFFMVCIALERYLVVACPLWYHFRRTIKISVVICVVVWILPPVLIISLYFWVDLKIAETLFAVFLLLPLPLFIFFLNGTLRALSTSRVASDEKRRIVGTLVLVLLIYTLLFLPIIIGYLAEGARNKHTFNDLSFTVVRLSPLADLLLYVFMRKGIVDKLLASVCCCRMEHSDSSCPSA